MFEERVHPEYRLRLTEHGDFLRVEVSGDVDAQAVRTRTGMKSLPKARRAACARCW